MSLHRGRIQAQGGGLEKSVSWNQSSPPTVDDGLKMIDDLILKLSPANYNIRKTAFKQAKEFILRAGEKNGIEHLVKKSFRAKGTKDVRVDIEILNGKAFVRKITEPEDNISENQSFI